MDCETPDLVPGDFELGSADSPVAIAIVGRGLVDVPPRLYHIKGRFKTENLGIEKMIMNVIRLPNVRYLVICGVEEFGHYPGDALYNLMLNGLDESDRIVGTRAPIPYVSNLPREAVERFRVQLTTIDLVNPKEVNEIIAYDPIYEITETGMEELLECLEHLNRSDSSIFPEGPMFVDDPTLVMDGGALGEGLNRAADRIISNMLVFPSEGLSVHTEIVSISQEFRLICDPQDGTIFEVPSMKMARRLRGYFTGGL